MREPPTPCRTAVPVTAATPTSGLAAAAAGSPSPLTSPAASIRPPRTPAGIPTGAAAPPPIRILYPISLSAPTDQKLVGIVHDRIRLMSAFNPYQWATFIGVVILGVFFSLGLQLFFMKVVLKPEKVARAAAERVGMAGDSLDYKKLGHLGTGLQEWVGAIEIILFSSSVVAGYPQFIGIWFGTKYIAAYKTWAKEPVGRTFYNRSLFGSGLNVLLGAATGGAALLAIHHAQGRTLDLSGLGRTVSRGASMLQMISGAIIAMLVAIWVEYLRRPSLGLIVEATPHDMKYEKRPAKALRAVRLKVYNKPLSG